MPPPLPADRRSTPQPAVGAAGRPLPSSASPGTRPPCGALCPAGTLPLRVRVHRRPLRPHARAHVRQGALHQLEAAVP
eukprot:6843489-Alexandrium_andersonii.AAC.1